jgi:predicted nucleic acid-binding protein
MAFGNGVLVDTNVLLRISRHEDPKQPLVAAALRLLESHGAGLYFSMQNMAEFWNVSTRPSEHNGFGLSALEAQSNAERIERRMTYLPDNDLVYTNWRRLLITHGICGVQVHDARLVAIMMAYGLTRILTLNTDDFERFPDIRAVHPRQVSAQSV